jgi:hypothetical protein
MASFYDIGSNWTPTNPSYAIFQVLSIPPSAVFSGKSYYDTLLGIGVYANSQWNYASGGGGAVTSVFGRTGIITAQDNDYTFAQLASKPTTVLGYGIVDAVTLTGIQTLTNKTIVGYQTTISLTTTGSSGAATLVGSTLNIPQYSGGGGGTTLQYMWVVGGANNFTTLPGTPTPPISGATTLVDAGLAGFDVRVYRNGLRQLGINPANGNSYYTKTKASNTVTFSQALTTGEEIIVETIPS